ncbi:pentapeptide repeat-containing protein [Microbacterium thalassium]|uniref:Uncharacterized protein YjbI with pentapeptide repeats n=1 Tax=Microbacterium thalassium TaxID=362649 RepID=A0A7X0KVA8_9MICO|nr:pentapeptide repeat-containing protein [Microbacterium thalassium]MBB6392042.1 uncharacterized protein YjbI with pentapeptide repeats [Microbacterium thalassium]GLK24998.1 hypothetical protein GCM10017607_23160 [Microbacterium thalassium]
MARANPSPAPPRVSPPDLPSVLDAGEAPTAGADAQDVRWTGPADVIEAPRATIEACVFDEVSADELVLTDATLIDVDLRAVRMPAVRARGARWRRVRVEGGRIGTLDLSDAELDEVELRGVRIDYLSLAGARVEDLVIADCTIGALDLPAARLTRVAFASTRADEVDTRDLRSTDLDLRGLEALAYLDVTGLRAATMSGDQVERIAAALAAGLGIRIQD